MLAEIPVSEESAVINTVLRQKLGFLPKSNIYSVFKKGLWGQQTRQNKLHWSVDCILHFADLTYEAGHNQYVLFYEI